ncbi:hypothetical protein [Fulvivirga sedimenti]|uniref:Uncharacterized protein n=1 Tax=Fulvivirga sedimenti TaxID=2879465 RepID=A0A9X1HQU5_9BACT|nr:hypothetical protein [Fulvivirga sedimenti]MCA6075104.1 hypothetical protein [Fulvivirga sedimenti]MCA6076281.1 hypothetical protein [Fulvivirga sedimenti]MCA6077409.1 hypothetical protein [Fulvivirga sedimenti]
MRNFIIFTGIWALSFLLITACEDSVYDEIVEEPVSETVSSDQKGNDQSRVYGFDQWGYNWNAHHFNGNVWNAIVADYLYQGEFFWRIDPYTGDDESYLEKYPWADQMPFWAYRNMELVMHWNEGLISKDGEYQDWLDSDAWITFHYKLGKGSDKWFQFQKFVAAKSTDYIKDGMWYDQDGNLIGIFHDWDTLIMIEVHDAGQPPYFKSPLSPGLGKYKLR